MEGQKGITSGRGVHIFQNLLDVGRKRKPGWAANALARRRHFPTKKPEGKQS
jgi:hypothetical protein